MSLLAKSEENARPRLRKADRRSQILQDLKLRPHIRISELADQFRVSTETVRRDVDELGRAGLLNRAHGGVSASAHGHYPDLDARSRECFAERERIGRRAAMLIEAGDTLMIDGGSTTMQFARFLAFNETPCTVVTNSLPIALTLGRSSAAEIILCPGEYLASESAVVGADAVEYLASHNVDRCFIGASGLSTTGLSESVRGFAAVKKTMLAHSKTHYALIDGGKFGKTGLSRVGELSTLTSIIVDRTPEPTLMTALTDANVEILIAPEGEHD